MEPFGGIEGSHLTQPSYWTCHSKFKNTIKKLPYLSYVFGHV